MRDNLHIVWTIASKDIVDSIRNKLIVSLILGMGIMLLMPKAMELMLVQPATTVVVVDPGESSLTAAVEESDAYELQEARSLAELKQVIGSSFGLGPEYGLVVPADFDQALESGRRLEVDGYLPWAKRSKAAAFQSEFEAEIEQTLGEAVHIRVEGNLVYPPPDSGLWLLMVTVMPVTVLLIMGMGLVPTLLLEEKQTKTMEALLVSPASVGQVVVGKAVAGFFYLLVAGGVVFAITWTGVVHWEVALMFVLGMGVFSVAVGLVMGSIFQRPQDVSGLTLVLLVVFVGTLLVDMLGMDLPSAVEVLVSWFPSVTLAKLLRLAYLEALPLSEALTQLGSVIGVSIPLYAAVAWKVRRSDR